MGVDPVELERCVSLARQVARTFVRDRGLPPDLGQEAESEAMVGLMLARESWQEELSSFRSWARRKIAYHLADWVRSSSWAKRTAVQRARRGDRPLTTCTAVSQFREPVALEEMAIGNGNWIQRVEDEDLVERILRGASSKVRSVIRGYYFDGLTFKQIGRLLGLSEGRISQIHADAMSRLREKAESLFGALEPAQDQEGRDAGMRMMIESTPDVTKIDGVEVRRWKGTTEDGVECEVFVHRIAVANSADCSQFDAALKEQLPPGRFVPFSRIL